MSIWMAVTADKFELPLCVADTANDLAKMLRISASTISSAVNQKTKRSNKNMKFVKVEVSEND